MPKQKKAAATSQRRNPTPKATRRSERTKANKRRAAETRLRRLSAAERRRESTTYTDPVTGKRHRGFLLSAVLTNRQAQSFRIATKRKQRHVFQELNPSKKFDHRQAGANHECPRDLL